jgi:hypothetical protein
MTALSAPAGIPTTIGATASMSGGMPSPAFISGRFSPDTAAPMTQVPRPRSVAASIRFSAASQQSAAAKALLRAAQMTISVPAL